MRVAASTIALVGSLLLGYDGADVVRAQDDKIMAPSTATGLVFDGVTVIDMEQGSLLLDQRVVVEGNRIRAVGTGRTVTIPGGAQVVAATVSRGTAA